MRRKNRPTKGNPYGLPTNAVGKRYWPDRGRPFPHFPTLDPDNRPEDSD